MHTCIHKPQAILCASSCLHCPHCHCHLPAQLPLPAPLQFATASIVAILHCNRLAIAQPKTCLQPAMSSPTAPPPIGKRCELFLLSAARLRALASAHGLPSSGRKSALIDQVYRRRSQRTRASSPPSATDGSPSRSPSPERSSRSRKGRSTWYIAHCPL